MAVSAMTREMGSGGREVAFGGSEALGVARVNLLPGVDNIVLPTSNHYGA